MKTKVVNFSVSIGLLGIVFLSSCSSKKEVTQVVTKSNEIELPFTSKEFKSNKEAFRASQFGKSIDLSTAKKIALLNAKSELAGNIQATIKKVTDSYTNQRTVSDKQDFENKFEELAREVVNQTLTEVKIIGEKVTHESNGGAFNYYIAIEISKDVVLNNVSDKISKKEKLQLDFDKKKFEEVLNAEMSKLEKE